MLLCMFLCSAQSMAYNAKQYKAIHATKQDINILAKADKVIAMQYKAIKH